MSRRSVHEWIILLTYVFALVLLTIHSGFLCRKLCFVISKFMPVFIAVVLAFVLNHPYKYVYSFFEKYIKLSDNVTRIVSIFLVYISLLGVIIAVVKFTLPHFANGLRQFLENRESYMGAFHMSLHQLTTKIGIEDIDLSPLSSGISEYLGQIDEIMNTLLVQMARITTGAIRGILGIGIIGVLSAYILYDKDHLKVQVKRFYKAYIPKQYQQTCRRFVETIIVCFDNFIIGQGLESVILGGLCWIGMVLLRLEYSGFVSFVVGLTAFIPFLGAYIGGALGAGLLLFVSVKKVMIFLIFFVILQQIENNFIYPRVVGKRTGLPGLWVIAAVTVGGGLFGVLGMIFSVPAATFVYIMLKRSVEIRESQNRAEADECEKKKYRQET